MTETKYDRERRQVDEAVRMFPPSFTLRAFPEMECRVASRNNCFVLDGQVQIVVECRRKGSDDAFAQLGRDTAANVYREAGYGAWLLED